MMILVLKFWWRRGVSSSIVPKYSQAIKEKTSTWCDI
jgi:hypothetical protein